MRYVSSQEGIFCFVLGLMIRLNDQPRIGLEFTQDTPNVKVAVRSQSYSGPEVCGRSRILRLDLLHS